MAGIAVLRKSILAALCAALLASGAASQTPPQSARPLAPDFKERALAHVRQLAGIGSRVAGSAGESKAASYIKDQMQKAGLTVAVEPFQFQSFELESAVLKVDDGQAEILKLGFDPYPGGESRTGELAFIESTDDMQAILKLELDGRIVVTTEAANFYRLTLFKKPAAVASLSRPDFDRLKAANGRPGEIRFRGRIVKTQSANIVGAFPHASGAAREIVISAHLDSWKGPGANDNASGVAVMLELARYFRALQPPPPLSMRFVAFSAEELGLVGARAYLQRHQSEFENCQLLFNIDSVGGAKEIFADTRGGVRSVPAKPASQLPENLNGKAINDIDARWMLVDPGQLPLFDSSNVPDWLRTAVAEAGKEVGREIVSANVMGSDHRVFVQAGVVATNIAISGAPGHTPDDVPVSVNAASLETAARIVAAVVEKAGRLGK